MLGPKAARLLIIPTHQKALRGETALYEHHVDDRVFAVRVQPLLDQQQVIIGCPGLAFDVTEQTRAAAVRQQAEQQLLAQRAEAEGLVERERLRHELFGSVSHDLRTPLTAARAALGLIETTGEGLAPGERQLLDNARRNLERLRLLVDDLVAANQLLAGAAPPALEAVPLDLRDVVAAAIAPLAPLLERRGQTLVQEHPWHCRCEANPRG